MERFPKVSSEGPSEDMARSFLERLAACLGLLALSPVLLVVAAAIAFERSGPVFFRQIRVGRQGKHFRLLKFRSMRGGPGTQITGRRDDRITTVGRYLRRYKIDELPQLWNVVRGDMSLIGPRPEIPEFVDLGDAVWEEVLSVRPGITDLATLVYRDEESLFPSSVDPEKYYREAILPSKLALNLHYLRTRTLWSDLKLIVLTLWYSIFSREFDPQRIRQRFQCEVQA